MSSRGIVEKILPCSIFHKINGPIYLRRGQEAAAREGFVVLWIKVYYFLLPSINQLGVRRTKKEKANLIFVSAHKIEQAEFPLVVTLKLTFSKLEGTGIWLEVKTGREESVALNLSVNICPAVMVQIFKHLWTPVMCWEQRKWCREEKHAHDEVSTLYRFT